MKKRPFAHLLLTALLASPFMLGATARAASPEGFLSTIRKHKLISSMVSDTGDSNPYAIVIAPVSAGKIHEGDVLIDDFSNVTNLQGTGTTLLDYNPSTRKVSVFARLPRKLKECPEGVGLTTAMAMLKTGWVIVGNTPSVDGTTRTKGPGGLLLLNADGELVNVWTGPNINDPWGNVALIDRGDTATLFISMAGFEVPGPMVIDPTTRYPVIVNKAKIVRFDLAIPDGKPPVIQSETVIADGLGEQADRDAFLIGPTGLTLGPNDTLYASDALSDRIFSISNASTRKDSAGLGKTVTQGTLLKHPLTLLSLPNGNLLACNGRNGMVVEIDPSSGKQIVAQWINDDQAQSPPGNGDLFGMALKPDGKGFYYVADDVNALMEASP